MKIPVFSTVATLYNKLNEVVRVFNKTEIDYYLWVQLPSELVVDAQLYDVHQVEPEDKEVDWIHAVDRNCSRPWLRIVSRILDDSVGLHVYKLSFINKHTDDVFQLYFGYSIQDDSPYKPYDYMTNERSHANECNPCKQTLQNK